MSDDLDEGMVQAALTTVWLGRPYRYVAEIGSTNDLLKSWATDERNPAGTVLLADYQTAGRGRLDRRWDAPPGTSLLFSVLLRPEWPAQRGGWLVMLAGLAVCEAIEAVAGLRARLKWPNDVVISYEGVWRKAGGLLLDSTLSPAGRLAVAVVGIGLNVNIPVGALPVATVPAASLLVAGGRPVNRRALLVALLERLERHYDAAAEGLSPWRAWNERLITLGQQVTVTAAGTGAAISGLATGTDEWGRLLVRDAAGIVHAVTAGDVTLQGR